MGITTFAFVSMLLVVGQEPSVLPTNRDRFSDTAKNESDSQQTKTFAVNAPNLEIPIEASEAERKNIREFNIFVSEDSQQIKLIKRLDPSESMARYQLPKEGIYRFYLMQIDKDGRKTPDDLQGQKPSMKIVYDSTSPIVQIRSVERVGDDVVVDWEVKELYPDYSTFRVDYENSNKTWIPVEAKASANQGRFTIPKALPNGLTAIRVQIQDYAKNSGQSIKDVSYPVPLGKIPSDNRTPSEGPSFTPIDHSTPIRSVENREPRSQGNLPDLSFPGNNTHESSGPIADNSPVIAQSPQPIATSSRHPVNSVSNRSDLESNTEKTPTVKDTERVLPKIELIPMTRFEVSFGTKSVGPSGIGKAQLWVTRDDGKSWVMWKEYQRPESSIEIDLNANQNKMLEGIYGLKIVLISGAGLTRGQPKPGDMPSKRIEVDLSAPEIKLYEPLPDPKEKDVLLLRWQAYDKHLANEPITLEWSERKDGGWQGIVVEEDPDVESNSTTRVKPATKRLANTSSLRWRLPAKIPPHVYLKITARDAAGNISEAITPKPVLVDLSRPEAEIMGIVGTGSPTPR